MPRRADPLVLDVASVLAAPGARHSYTLAGRLPGTGLPSARLPDPAEVQVDLVLEAQGLDVVADGTVRAAWVGECRRCLGPTSGEVEVTFREVWSVHPVEGETYPLKDQRLDLRPMLEEAVTLALPLAPLCREDCPGPDPEAHPVGTSGEPGGAGPEGRGSRADVWAALDELDL